METRCLTSVYLTSDTVVTKLRKATVKWHPSTGVWVQVPLDSEAILPCFGLAPSPSTLLRTSQLETGSDSCPSRLFPPQAHIISELERI